MRSRWGAAAVGAWLAAALVVVPGTAQAGTTDVVGGGRLGEKGVVVGYGPDAAPLPAVPAGGWLVADATTGEVLASKGAHNLLRPASTIKTLTALAILDSLDLDAQHEVAWAEAAADGGKVGIVPGATYTVRDLLHGLLLPSGNDAAEALAAANGGREQTIAQMQAIAEELGAADTSVRNPSGLDEDGQLTSAYDLALIARAALANPAFAELTRTVSYDFPGRPVKAGKKRTTYKIYTQNRLLTKGYDGAIGGKTGYTTLAGRTFWGAATRDGRTLVVTILRAGGRTEDGARALLDWGFANAAKVTPVGTLVEPGQDPGGTPTVQPIAGAGAGVAAAASTPAADGSSSWLPWVLVGLLLVVGAAVLWWGRVHDAARGRGGSAGPGDATTPAPARAPADEGPAGSAGVREPGRTSPPPTGRHAGSGSVRVRSSRPGGPAHGAPAPAAPSPATASRAPDPVTEPRPDPAPVAVPVEDAAPEPAAPTGDEPTLERAKPRPLSGGHVKVIGPVSRPDRDSSR